VRNRKSIRVSGPRSHWQWRQASRGRLCFAHRWEYRCARKCPSRHRRIERLWETFQDRWVSELRLARAKTKQQAQTVLERYLCVHNRRLSRPALNASACLEKSQHPSDRPCPVFQGSAHGGERQYDTFEGTVFQIPKQSPFHSYANKRIDVHLLLDGAVELFYQNEKIAAFDAKTTHAFGLYRTHGKQEGFRLRTYFHSINPAPGTATLTFSLCW
jgi:hypothetical protein